MPEPTYADIARLTPGMTPDQVEQWAASRNLSAKEAYRIWNSAHVNPIWAEEIWKDEEFWTDAKNPDKVS